MNVSNKDMIDIINKFEELIKEGKFTKEQIKIVNHLLRVWSAFMITDLTQEEVDFKIDDFSLFCDKYVEK